MKWKILIFVNLLLLGVFTASCSSQPPTSATESDDPPSIDSSYPIQESDFNQGYPYPVDTGKGLMEDENRGPDFFIEIPVLAGDLIVSGTGPTGVPIELLNVTKVGQILSKTSIDQNGNFTFELSQPLESGHSLGIRLGDISNTDFLESDFLYNENYYDRPLIGILFDMVVVE